VTGFGLLGHAAEMAAASGVGMLIYASALPILPGAIRYAGEGQLTGGAGRNRTFFQQVTVDSSVEQPYAEVAWDPQTSGGLLIAAPPDLCDDLLMALEEEGVQGCSIGHVSEGRGVALVTK
jgi:selenide,water dikinase